MLEKIVPKIKLEAINNNTGSKKLINESLKGKNKIIKRNNDSLDIIFDRIVLIISNDSRA